MIENWKDAWRMHSVQVAAVIAAVAGLESFLPKLEGVIPSWAFAVLSIAVVVARVIRQPSLQAPESVVEELKRIKSIAKKGGLISLVVLFLVGCSGRRACRAEADASFNAEVERCGEEGFTYDDCPYIPAAEDHQDEDYKRCP